MAFCNVFDLVKKRRFLDEFGELHLRVGMVFRMWLEVTLAQENSNSRFSFRFCGLTSHD